MIEDARIDAAGTIHACDVSAGLVMQGGYDPGIASMACGCRVLVHRFKCPGCERLMGWCMGCSDELEDFCDQCWDAASTTWKRLRASARDLLLAVGDPVDATEGGRFRLLPERYRVRTLVILRALGLVETRVEEREGMSALIHVRVTGRGARTLIHGRRRDAA